MDGRSIKSIFVNDLPNRLTEVQYGATVNTTLVRDFSQDRMKVTLIANDVVSTSSFRRTDGGEASQDEEDGFE